MKLWTASFSVVIISQLKSPADLPLLVALKDTGMSTFEMISSKASTFSEDRISQLSISIKDTFGLFLGKGLEFDDKTYDIFLCLLNLFFKKTINVHHL